MVRSTLKSMLFVLAALLATLLPVQSSFGFEQLKTNEGVALRWQKPEVEVYINTRDSGLSESQLEEVVRACLQTWEAINFGLKFKYMGTTAVNESASDDLNVIFFVKDPAVWSETFPGQETALAMTRSWATQAGELTGFDMAFNSSRYSFTTTDTPQGTTDLANTLTHELGHVLGLDHSEVEEAVMYTTAPIGETDKRSLARDDIQGIWFIYQDGFQVIEPYSPFGCSVAPPGVLASRSTEKSGRWPSEAIFGLLLSTIPALRVLWRRRVC